MTPGDAYWVGAPGRGNPHSASVVVNTCSNKLGSLVLLRYHAVSLPAWAAGGVQSSLIILHFS